MPGYANNSDLTIMAITKAVIAVAIVVGVFYCMITGVYLDEGVLQLLLLILAGYFGLSADVYRRSARSQARQDARLQRVLDRMNLADVDRP